MKSTGLDRRWEYYGVAMKKVLFLEWESFGNQYMKKELELAGFQVISFTFSHKKEDTRKSEELAMRMASEILSTAPQFVFSFNYFPVAAIACKACRIPYLSWTYDSPFIQIYSKTIEYPTNYAFVFDRAEYYRLQKLAPDRVFYLPMAAPVEAYEQMVPGEEQKKKYAADVAMIGSMYTEPKHQIFKELEKADEYTKGYLEALMRAQKGLYGCQILEPALTEEMMTRIRKVCPLYSNGDGLESAEWVFANYYLARKVTAMERKEALQCLSERYDVAVYTPEATPELPKVRNLGTVDYYTQAPLAMKAAKINLNITLRSIGSGIPLRAMDIMGCGGFLMTNYQEDFLEYFVPGEDFVYFEDTKDLADKTGYYLTHEEERLRIAGNGHEKMKMAHTYRDRLQQMLTIAGL